MNVADAGRSLDINGFRPHAQTRTESGTSLKEGRPSFACNRATSSVLAVLACPSVFQQVLLEHQNGTYGFRRLGVLCDRHTIRCVVRDSWTACLTLVCGDVA